MLAWKYDGFSNIHIRTRLAFPQNGGGRAGVFLGDIFFCLNYDTQRAVLYQGASLLGSYSTSFSKTPDSEIRTNPNMYTIEMRKRGVVKAINKLVLGKEDFISTMRKNVEAVIGEEAGQGVDEIEEKLAGLQDELVWLASGGQNYEAVVEEIYRLRELKGKILAGSADLCGKRQRVAEMEEFLNSQSGILFEFDDKLVRRIVNRVTVYGCWLTVEFKTGTEVSVDI